MSSYRTSVPSTGRRTARSACFLRTCLSSDSSLQGSIRNPASKTVRSVRRTGCKTIRPSAKPNALSETLAWFEKNLKTPDRFNRTRSKGYYRRNTKGIAMVPRHGKRMHFAHAPAQAGAIQKSLSVLHFVRCPRAALYATGVSVREGAGVTVGWHVGLSAPSCCPRLRPGRGRGRSRLGACHRRPVEPRSVSVILECARHCRGSCPRRLRWASTLLLGFRRNRRSYW